VKAAKTPNWAPDLMTRMMIRMVEVIVNWMRKMRIAPTRWKSLIAQNERNARGWTIHWTTSRWKVAKNTKIHWMHPNGRPMKGWMHRSVRVTIHRYVHVTINRNALPTTPNAQQMNSWMHPNAQPRKSWRNR
jgi:hypothetical protein